jgi:hypothetical protein
MSGKDGRQGYQEKIIGIDDQEKRIDIDVRKRLPAGMIRKR